MAVVLRKTAAIVKPASAEGCEVSIVEGLIELLGFGVVEDALAVVLVEFPEALIEGGAGLEVEYAEAIDVIVCEVALVVCAIGIHQLAVAIHHAELFIPHIYGPIGQPLSRFAPLHTFETIPEIDFVTYGQGLPSRPHGRPLKHRALHVGVIEDDREVPVRWGDRQAVLGLGFGGDELDVFGGLAGREVLLVVVVAHHHRGRHAGQRGTVRVPRKLLVHPQAVHELGGQRAVVDRRYRLQVRDVL